MPHSKNRMFRSVFIKYMSAFMLINLVCFGLLSLIITSLIRSYGTENQMRFLDSSATSLERFLATEYSSVNSVNKISFSEYLLESGNEISPAIDLVSESVTDILVFITDTSGEIYASRGGGNIFLETQVEVNDDGKYVVPSNIIGKVMSEGKYSDTSDLEGFLNEKNLVSAKRIKLPSGTVIGTVFLCTEDTGVDVLLDATIKTIIMSCLWIMLASLIATYFISERLVSPIKDMSRAARSFADGKFDVRVTVTGSDEISELATAFNNMASSLQELEDMRRSFLANVSHDLRTPMTTISGFIDGILDGAIPPDKYDYYLGVIATEVRRLSRLVSTLLDITKLQAGERKFKMEAFDICEMARLILISFEQKIDEKKLSVDFNCDSERMFVCADRDAIYQVLYNICDNGIKFAFEGGKYEIGITEQNKKTVISVFNEGEGIPTEDQKYIFDRFFKSDHSRGLNKTGVGLGMYIARTIIEAHGEKIWLESEPGKYCRFTFTLPSAIDAEQVEKNTSRREK